MEQLFPGLFEQVQAGFRKTGHHGDGLRPAAAGEGFLGRAVFKERVVFHAHSEVR